MLGRCVCGFYVGVLFILVLLSGCISPDNSTIEGLGTPDITGCAPIPDVENGANYEPRTEAVRLSDDRLHPDVFYIGWSSLDDRSDLRFPEKGYDATGFEDKLLVSRKMADGNVRTWQLLPQLDSNCHDLEKIRIHSFDVAPNGRSLYLSMARTPLTADGAGSRDSRLGIYRFDIKNNTLTKISTDNGTHFMYPTYIGNDPTTKHEMLAVAKTVTKTEIPVAYARSATLQDEYDRSPTPLIHKIDTSTGATVRLGFNNSHQTDPFVMDTPDGVRSVIFTQWEHQANVNRFSLWKMQIDGSDEFTFYGQESTTAGCTLTNRSANGCSAANLFQGRVVQSNTDNAPYKNYVLMTQGHRTDKAFAAEGDIVMTKRVHSDLRSDKIPLQSVARYGSTDTDISRNPEYYNDESFVYSYRRDSGYTYEIYVKDFPANPNPNQIPPPNTPGTKLSPTTDKYHFVQARSFYPPEREQIAPTDAHDLGENRVSFTNSHLNNHSGWLVENLRESDNGAQNQLGGLPASDIALQFFVPSHHLGGGDDSSYAIGIPNSPEMSIPASGFISPESDGSLGVVVKKGLYVWKVNKRFSRNGDNIWIPIRAEPQEINFVPNRVNACNQCHQERSQFNVDKYANYDSIAADKMRGNLTDVPNIVDFNVRDAVPDFHRDIMPLLTKPGLNGGQSCTSCHKAGTKLNLSNETGPEAMNATYRTLLQGAHKLPSGKLVAYSSDDINPLGVDNSYHPAPFMWSLLLNDDLSVPPDATHPNGSSRTLERPGDYGATYDAEVSTAITDINTQYDHSKHWSAADLQKFITYSTTQMRAGLSDRITFQSQGANYRSGSAAQKAYQAMVKNCFSCHNSFTARQQNGVVDYGGGVEDPSWGLPWEKSFSSSTAQHEKTLRFMIHNHVAAKDATKYSKYSWQSDLRKVMRETLASATYRIDYNNPLNSELLVYALGKDPQGNSLTKETHHVNHQAIFASDTDPDYLAIKNWVEGSWTGITNNPPSVNPPSSITLEEYAPPSWLHDSNGVPYKLEWSDADDLGDGSEELSQAFIEPGNSDEYSFNDTMVALEYEDFKSAKVETYAILGDRGTHNLRVGVTDGDDASTRTQNLPVTVTSTYTVPTPSATMPEAYAFYTVRQIYVNGVLTNPNEEGRLHKLETSNEAPGYKDAVVGAIEGYNNDWSTVYRRSDKGWLYFLEQETQTIHVVNETNAQVMYHIKLNHTPNKYGDSHKQTNYLLWWRPTEGLDHMSNYRNANGDEVACTSGELQGLLESKLSSDQNRNGDFYIGLGCAEALDDAQNYPDKTITVVPEWRTKLADGANTLAVYTWKRATFMSKWVNGEVDRMNVLNLVTGKAKNLGAYSFPTKTVSDITYPAADYWNLRAVVVAEDGAFYGFNKDINTPTVTVFNFDPLQEIQTPVTTPSWVQTYFDHYLEYGTPFLVIKPRP